MSSCNLNINKQSVKISNCKPTWWQQQQQMLFTKKVLYFKKKKKSTFITISNVWYLPEVLDINQQKNKCKLTLFKNRGEWEEEKTCSHQKRQGRKISIVRKCYTHKMAHFLTISNAHYHPDTLNINWQIIEKSYCKPPNKKEKIAPCSRQKT